MLSPLRNRFGIPGVISVIALVFAMFGGAYAASNSSEGDKATASAKAKQGPRGPRGKTGKTGPAGPAGPQGPAGAKGDTGAAGSNGTNGKDGVDGQDGTDGTSVTSEQFVGTKDGKCGGLGGSKFVSASGPTYACNGEEGPEGSPWTDGGTLPPGATETGVWDFVSDEGKELEYAVISFPIPLSVADAAAVTPNFVKDGSPTSDCPGTPLDPQAEPGFLCVYGAAARTGGGGESWETTGGSPFGYMTPDFGIGVGPSGTLPFWEFLKPGSFAGGSFAITAPE